MPLQHYEPDLIVRLLLRIPATSVREVQNATQIPQLATSTKLLDPFKSRAEISAASTPDLQMLQILFDSSLLWTQSSPLHLIVALDQMQAEASEKQPLLLQDTTCLL